MWHPQTLREIAGGTWATAGDTEPVARLLAQQGPAALPLLDGMFALAWADQQTLYLARDPYGEIPLHIGRTRDNRVVYASEIGPLLSLGAVPHTVRWVPPGHVLSVTADGHVSDHQWFTGAGYPADASLRQLLDKGVIDRAISDVPVAVLASGGLDSSAIITTLRHHVPNLVAYTAVGDSRSADLRHARIVCHELGVPLVEVPVPPPTAAALAATVGVIEMPHKAQVEIAHACHHLGYAMHTDGIKVVLSGEGSDELWASYGMAYHGINAKGWDGYRRATFIGQHRKNFARTNKVFMRHGIEARLPFLSPPLVSYALDRTQQEVTMGGQHVKAILAAAYPELPRATAWRAKVAFQTGQKIDRAAAAAVADPRRFYTAEFNTQFRGVSA